MNLFFCVCNILLTISGDVCWTMFTSIRTIDLKAAEYDLLCAWVRFLVPCPIPQVLEVSLRMNCLAKRRANSRYSMESCDDSRGMCGMGAFFSFMRGCMAGVKRQVSRLDLDVA